MELIWLEEHNVKRRHVWLVYHRRRPINPRVKRKGGKQSIISFLIWMTKTRRKQNQSMDRLVYYLTLILVWEDISSITFAFKRLLNQL
jgi:membrane protein required for beta-lactamase induction